MKIKQVLEAVANFYGVSTEQILSNSRVKPISEARQMACYILNDLPITKMQLAKELNIDRSAVYYHTERMSFFIAIYEEFDEKYQEIITKINEYHDHKIDT